MNWLILAALAVVGVAIWKGRTPPPLCDSCKHLKMKGGDLHRYSCRKRHFGYDNAPTICADYERFKTEE